VLSYSNHSTSLITIRVVTICNYFVADDDTTKVYRQKINNKKDKLKIEL